MKYVSSFYPSTAHLSLVEYGAYCRLSFHYDYNGFKLPAEFRRCTNIANALSKAERRAVKYVLAEFFRLSDCGEFFVHV